MTVRTRRASDSKSAQPQMARRTRRIDSVFGSVIVRDLKTSTRAELQIVADNWLPKSSASVAIR